MVSTKLFEQKVHLITFADGSPEYRRAADRLEFQAKKLKGIDHIHKFCKSDLGEEYHKIFPKFPKTYKKGFGLWSWKPFLVSQTINNINTGDILIYVDAGCEINIKGQKKFQEYIELVNLHEAVFFQVPHKHSNWTKKELLDLYDAKLMNQNQIMGTFFILKNTNKIRSLVYNWLQLCSDQNGKYLKDPIASSSQNEGFISHRHDQSCLSCCVLNGNFFKIENDDTWNSNLKRLNKNPIIALRNRTGISKLYKVRPFPLNIFGSIIAASKKYTQKYLNPEK